MEDVVHDRDRDDRMLRYGACPLNQDQWIVIRIEADYAGTYAGQVASLVAASLVGRLSQSVAIDAPDIPIVDSLPGADNNLATELLAEMQNCNPRGRYARWSNQCDAPYVVHLGHHGHEEVVHGHGWSAYIGPSPSPIPPSPADPLNPIGPAFSAVAAATQMFVHRFDPPPTCRVFDCYAWSSSDGPFEGVSAQWPPIPGKVDLGDIWAVGCGSVGSAILYFLGLAGAGFSVRLFDMDQVERHNLTRSPLFKEHDIRRPKVAVAGDFLRNCGISDIREYASPLDQIGIWSNRSKGVPDVLIPAANERNVRSLIEGYYPPLQIYGATGTNWQASSISHVPLISGCSLCLFPETRSPAMACATDADASSSNSGESQVDSSLPFLSFAAGLMAVADLLKTALGVYPYLGQRGILYAWDGPRLSRAPTHQRSDCICGSRSADTHKAIICGSRYADFSY